MSDECESFSDKHFWDYWQNEHDKEMERNDEAVWDRIKQNLSKIAEEYDEQFPES